MLSDLWIVLFYNLKCPIYKPLELHYSKLQYNIVIVKASASVTFF